jgi:hypothetical protein
VRTSTHRLEGTVAVPALACALALVALASFAAAVAAGGAPPPPEVTVVEASWADRPASVEAASKRSLFIVEARVSGVRTGAGLTTVEDIGGGLTETDTTPTQLIDFSTRDAIHGSPPSTFTINKTGSSVWWIEGDPPYAVGERYLLFVERFVDDSGAASNYTTVGPDGRLFIDADNILHAFIDGPVALQLDGRPLEVAKSKTRLALLESGIVPAPMLPPLDGGLPDETAVPEAGEDAVGDADDHVSGAGTGALETQEGVGVPNPPQVPSPCPPPPAYCVNP